MQPGKTAMPIARKRTAARKFQLVACKLFYDTDRDLIRFWDGLPDGSRSDVLRDAIRDRLIAKQSAPTPATNHDVIGQADRSMAYAEQLAKWAIEQQQQQTTELLRQVSELTRQVADLTARLAQGAITVGQAAANTAAAPTLPDESTLTPEQAAARLAKVKARKW
jgi:hypothetical protein